MTHDMRWHRVADVTVSSWDTFEEGETGLWTRGGLQLAVTHNGNWIDIPRDVILSLVAEEIRETQASRWESMSDCEALKCFGLDSPDDA